MFPVAQYEIHENIISKIGCVGNFYKNGICFVATSSSKKIFIFDSNAPPEESKTFIKIGQKISCIETCFINDHDCIVIGTDNSLQIFDPILRAPIFNNLISDGVYSIYISENKTIYVGSNTSIIGYNFSGEEVFWTITGDIVTSLCEITYLNSKALIAASNDLMIRLFIGEESIKETKINNKVEFLKSFGPNEFLAIFSNGTIGFYNDMQLQWIYSSKSPIIGVQIANFLGKPNLDIIIASTDGKIYFLDKFNGQPSKTDDLNTNISLLNLNDFSNDGRQYLGIITSNGGIRIFMSKGIE